VQAFAQHDEQFGSDRRPGETRRRLSSRVSRRVAGRPEELVNRFGEFFAVVEIDEDPRAAGEHVAA
jgi:hypothetical protein